MAEKGRRILNYIRRYFFQTVTLCLIAGLLWCFVAQKEGYHMDELLSYELANAEFNPWIVPTQPEGRLAKFVRNEIDGDTLGETLGNVANVAADLMRNRGNSLLARYQADVYDEPVWITAKQFHDYITVDGTDAFNYLSVYFNVKDDNHPPLHFMLLHTISSLWRGKAEPFMGCLINLASVLGCCILMMRLGLLLDETDVFGKPFPMEKQGSQNGAGGKKRTGAWLGILSALMYGLSSGAVATTLLIRMYGLMTFLCVALFYIHVKKWQNKEFASRNKWLIAVTVLGFWTQYFFLFYCICLAVVTAALLTGGKRWKDLKCYVRSMVTAAAIGLATFPFAISDVFSSGRGVEALDNLKNGVDGYGTRLAAFAKILLTRMFGSPKSALGHGILLLLFLLIVGLVWGAWREWKCKRPGSMPLLLMFLLPPAGYFLLAARMSPYLVDRYIMAVFPFAMMACACAIFGVCRLIAQGRREWMEDGQAVSRLATLANMLLVIWAGILCLNNLRTYDGEYLYRGYSLQEQVSREYHELPCICVYDGVGYYENLREFSNYSRTLLIKAQELENRNDKESLNELDSVVVLTKQNADAHKAQEALEQQYGLYPVRRLVENSVYGDQVWLYERQ